MNPTHPEHDEERESLVRWIADKAQAFAEDKPVATFPVAEVRKRIAAHTAKAVEEAQLETFEFCIANFKSKAYILDKYNALKVRSRRKNTRRSHDPAI